MIALSRLRTRLDLLIRRLLVQSRIYKDPFEYDELRFVTNAFPIQSFRERERERVIKSKQDERKHVSELIKRSDRLSWPILVPRGHFHDDLIRCNLQ